MKQYMPLDRKPNLFVAGAPKCGTTSLAAWLSEHPNCYVTPKKEPHFFSNFMRNNMSLKAYEKLFSNVHTNHSTIVDASTSYFNNPRALRRILAYNPSAKFILMFRNPVDLAYSLHAEVLYRGVETEQVFETAWRLQGLRKQGMGIPYSCRNPEMLFYRNQCLLGGSLKKLLELVDSLSVHCIFLEDLKTNPRQCYMEALKFCGLSDDGRLEFPVYNRSKYHRFPRLNSTLQTLGLIRASAGLPGIGLVKAINRIGRKEQKRPLLRKEFKLELYDEFRADIALLEKLTGRDLSKWQPITEN